MAPIRAKDIENLRAQGALKNYLVSKSNHKSLKNKNPPLM
jgi:hypothetical protein|tara:strand:- start:1038 stop:1157 length:120 start_codon:yes stop_codon:yes gene_type:complete